MELFKLFGTIAVKNEEANEAIDETTGKAEQSEGRISGAFKKIGAVVATAFAVDKIVAFGKAAVEASATVAAEQSAFEQIMGDYSNTAQQKVNEIADATGMVSTRLTPYMTSMTAKFKGLGYDIGDATDLAQSGLNLAADAAAFWDKSLDDSMSALNSFINGSYEGGEAIGLFANDTQMASYAVKQGIVGETKEWANLDEARKQATRLQYAQDMMKASGATGQAAKEAGQYANVQANLTEKWRQFKAEIGEPILQNIVLPAMQKLSDILDLAREKFPILKQAVSDAWNELSVRFAPAIELVKGALEALPGAISAIGGIISSFIGWLQGGSDGATALKGALVAVGTGFAVFKTGLAIVGGVQKFVGVVKKAAGSLKVLFGVMAANPILVIVAAIAGLVAAFIYFWNTSEDFRNFWIGLWETIKGAVSGVWEWLKSTASSIIETLKSGWESFKEGFKAVWDAIKGAADTVLQGIQDGWSAFTTFFSDLWNGIVTVVSTVWETIKNVVSLGLQTIGLIISTAVQIIILPFQFIWENCKGIITAAWTAISTIVSTWLNTISTIISTVMGVIKTILSTIWNAIKTVITTVVNAIKSVVTNVWNGIKSVTSSVFNAVKSVATTVWNAIKSAVTTVVNAIKSVITNVWNAIKSVTSSVFNAVKSVASSVWNGIKSTITNVVNTVKSTVSNVWNGIKSTTSSVFEGIKGTASRVWNSIKDAITKPIDKAKSLVKSGIDKMKGFFNFKWELPKLKLPHFGFSGKFSLNPPSVPKFSVKWYKKGGIMEDPTMFGFDPTTMTAHVGGEAGAEAITPIDVLLDYVRTAVREENGGTASRLERLIALLEKYLLEIILNMAKDIYLDTGELVGAMGGQIDAKLGDIAALRRRGQ